jgi:hypothetical protein
VDIGNVTLVATGGGSVKKNVSGVHVTGQYQYISNSGRIIHSVSFIADPSTAGVNGMSQWMQAFTVTTLPCYGGRCARKNLHFGKTGMETLWNEGKFFKREWELYVRLSGK